MTDRKEHLHIGRSTLRQFLPLKRFLEAEENGPAKSLDLQPRLASPSAASLLHCSGSSVHSTNVLLPRCCDLVVRVCVRRTASFFLACLGTAAVARSARCRWRKPCGYGMLRRSSAVMRYLKPLDWRELLAPNGTRWQDDAARDGGVGTPKALSRSFL